MNKTDVGGVSVTLEEIQEARQKLATTGSTAIKQVLAAIDNPLASCDYWGEIKAALAAHPELEVASQTKSNHAQHAKVVFDFVLAGKEATLSGRGQAAPCTADDAYTPPPRGGEVPKSLVFETDPDKIDRGTTAHKDTQDALAEALRKAGLKPRSPKLGDPAFDIAWRDDEAEGVAFICEVKSLTDENETGQIRLAIGQVLDYVHTLDSLREAGSLPPHWEGVHAVRRVVAVERQPAKDVRWAALCEKHGIILTWPEKYADTLATLASTGLCDTEFELPVMQAMLCQSSPPGTRSAWRCIGPAPARNRVAACPWPRTVLGGQAVAELLWGGLVGSARDGAAQDDGGDRVVKQLELAHSKVIRVCEDKSAGGPAHGVLGCLAGVEGGQPLVAVVAGLSRVGFAEGGDVDAELFD